MFTALYIKLSAGLAGYFCFDALPSPGAVISQTYSLEKIRFFCRIFVAEGRTELTAQARLLGVYLKFWRPSYRSSTSSILLDINHTLASLERTLTLRSM